MEISEITLKSRLIDLELSARVRNSLKQLQCDIIGDALFYFFKDGIALPIKVVKVLYKKHQLGRHPMGELTIKVIQQAMSPIVDK
jgi:hypothetical protein